MPTIQEIRQQYPQYSDMSDAALADALYKKNYSDMPRAEFDTKIGMAQPSEIPTDASPRPTGRLPKGGALDELKFRRETQEETQKKMARWGGVAHGANDPFNAMTQMGLRVTEAMGMNPPGDIERVDRKIAQEEAQYQASPARGEGFDSARMFGSAIPTTAAMGAVPMGGGAVARTALGGVQGALGGALQPVYSGDFATEKAKQVGMGFGTGALVSGGLALKDKLQALRNRPDIPSTAQIKSSARQAFNDVKSSGVVVSQSAFDKFADTVDDHIADLGYHPKMHPRISILLEDIGSLRGATPTLQRLHTLRKLARNAGSSADSSERMLAGEVIDKLDDWLPNLKPTDMVGDRKGIDAMYKGIKEWRMASVSESMEDMVQRAGSRAGQFTGSGFENALRTEFRQFALNAKKMRGLSSVQRKAIEKVNKGGAIGNIARWIGKWAPTGVVSATAGGGAGGLAAGPLGAVAVPAMGAAGRVAAEALTSRNARLASELARGGPRAAATLPPLTPQQDIMRRLLLTGSVSKEH